MDFTKQQKLQAKREELEGEDSKKKTQRVPFLKLFCFADSWDYVLMAIASVGACVHGASVPVFFIFFGKLINIVGVASLFPTQVSNRVAKYSLDLVYLAIVILFSSWNEVACWMHTGERQAAKMRLAYLRSLLDQDFTTLQHCLMEPNLILANFEGRHSNSTFVKMVLTPYFKNIVALLQNCDEQRERCRAVGHVDCVHVYFQVWG